MRRLLLLLTAALLVVGCSSGPQVINGYSFDPFSTCETQCDKASDAVRAWAASRGGAVNIELHRPAFKDSNLRVTSGSWYVAVVKLGDGSMSATGVGCTMGCSAGLPMLR